MQRNKTRRILAVIALAFMAVFSVTLVIVFINPDLWNGAFGYMALISGLLGIGLFLVIKLLLKDESEEKDPEPDKPEDAAAAENGTDNSEDATAAKNKSDKPE